MACGVCGLCVCVTLSQAEEKLHDLQALESNFDELMEVCCPLVLCQPCSGPLTHRWNDGMGSSQGIRDFSALVAMQGAQVEIIALNVAQAANFIAKGKQELVIAHHHQKQVCHCSLHMYIPWYLLCFSVSHALTCQWEFLNVVQCRRCSVM